MSLRYALKKHINRIKWNLNHLFDTTYSNPDSPDNSIAVYDLLPSIWNLVVQYFEVTGIAEKVEQISEQRLTLIVVLFVAIFCLVLF
jgi:hypothetical protein